MWQADASSDWKSPREAGDPAEKLAVVLRAPDLPAGQRMNTAGRQGGAAGG